MGKINLLMMVVLAQIAFNTAVDEAFMRRAKIDVTANGFVRRANVHVATAQTNHDMSDVNVFVRREKQQHSADTKDMSFELPCGLMESKDKTWYQEPEPEEDEVEAFQRLFAKWNGKTVIFGGDSLMRALFWFITRRGARVLRGTVSADPVTNAWWPSEAGGVISRNYSQKDLENREWANAIDRGGFYHEELHVKGVSVVGEVLSFVGKSLVFHRLTELVMNELFGQMTDANVVFFNLGHVAISPEWATVEDFKAIASKVVDKAKSADIPMVFVEHPPSHFDAPHGDYLDHARGAPCKCHPAGEMYNQYSYRCERVWLEPFARQHGFTTARWFDDLIDKCDNHCLTYRDCRHYQMSWSVYRKLTETLCTSTDEISHSAL